MGGLDQRDVSPCTTFKAPGGAFSSGTLIKLDFFLESIPSPLPTSHHGCQMAITGFLDRMCLSLGLLDYGSATLRCKILPSGNLAREAQEEQEKREEEAIQL